MYGYFTVIFPNHFMDIVGVVAKAAAMNPGSEMVSCCSHMRNGEAEDYYITSENEDKKYDFEFKDHTWLWFETTWYLTNSIWFYGISKILMISIILGLFLFP
ncbi:hypothetical protein M6B38_137005 [Iris pallida]|uniref:Uncharacterized protein n=1 Tax=Iris pallida TaxID=29817 RepID=A0AAX6FE12_IRIPA|nr:hypothetical protein M6B38_137005 [Iris pallida]